MPSIALPNRKSLSPSKTPLSTRCAFIADRRSSTKRYSNNRSIAVRRPGNLEKASENKSCSVGASSGRASSGSTSGSGRDAISGFDRRAHQLGTLFLWAAKTMPVRTRKKHDARRINDNLAGIWLNDRKLSLLERMKMSHQCSVMITGASAQPPGIKHPSRERKFFEEGCESIQLRLEDISTVL